MGSDESGRTPVPRSEIDLTAYARAEITAARARMHDLEQRIRAAIAEFEHDFGLKVDRVEIVRAHEVNGESRIAAVRLEVAL